MTRQAVILAGGKGTRLAARLNGLPKPLVLVCGKPLLQRQIEELRTQGFQRIVVLVNHRADAIRDFLARHANFGIDIEVVDDGEPRGTAGAVLAALDHLDDRFLVVYGDTLFAIDSDAMWQSHLTSHADATLLLHPNDHPADSDLVEIDAQGRITRFWPYPHQPDMWLRNLVNAAFYIVERAALARIAHMAEPSDFAKDLFPAMLAKGCRLQGYESFEYIKDLGTPDRLDRGERHLASGMVERARRSQTQAAVFLDRDGTLNVPNGFIARPQDLELYPYAGQAVKRLHDAEFRTIVVTNQPVIARGDCDEVELSRIHAKLETALGHEGAFLDGLFYCPHHPDGGYEGERAELKIICTCRKPETGLIARAVERFNIDLSASWFVGDSTSDIACANRAGLRAVLVQTGESGRDGKYEARPDFVCADVADAAVFITHTYPELRAKLQPLFHVCKAGDRIAVHGMDKTSLSVLRCELRARGLVADCNTETGEVHVYAAGAAPTRELTFDMSTGQVQIHASATPEKQSPARGVFA